MSHTKLLAHYVHLSNHAADVATDWSIRSRKHAGRGNVDVELVEAREVLEQVDLDCLAILVRLG